MALPPRPPLIPWEIASSFPLPSLGMYQGLGSGVSLEPIDLWFVNLEDTFRTESFPTGKETPFLSNTFDNSAVTKRLTAFLAVLNSQEQERAQRFVLPILRDRFVVARGLLRLLISHYTGIDPAHIELIYSDRGKPSLKPTSGQSLELEFNLSHCHNYLLYAFSRHPVGIDVEQITSRRDVLGIAQRFFTPEERTLLEQLDPAEQSIAFLRHWVCKEAYVKATGEGLAAQLQGIQVEFTPQSTRIFQPHIPPSLQLWEFSPSLQTIAALVSPINSL